MMAVFHLVAVSRIEEDLSRMLPTRAIDQGYCLRWIAPEEYKSDPVVLIRGGWEQFRWNYIPSMGEVWEKIEELGRV